MQIYINRYTGAMSTAISAGQPVSSIPTQLGMTFILDCIFHDGTSAVELADDAVGAVIAKPQASYTAAAFIFPGGSFTYLGTPSQGYRFVFRIAGDALVAAIGVLPTLALPFQVVWTENVDASIDLVPSPYYGRSTLPQLLVANSDFQDDEPAIENPADAYDVPSAYELVAHKGVANGYAELDETGKVPVGELPSSSFALGAPDISSFGAVGDGTTDDTSAINAALTAGSISVGPGTYKVSAPLLVPSNRMVLVSPAATFVCAASSGSSWGVCFFTNSNPSGGNTNITILGGNYNGTGSASTVGFRFNNCTNVTVKGARFLNVPNFGMHCANLSNFVFEDIHADFGTAAIGQSVCQFENNVSYGFIRNVSAANCGDDMVAFNAADIGGPSLALVGDVGDIHDILVDGVVAESGCPNGIRLLTDVVSDNPYNIYNITARNFSGIFGDHVIEVSNLGLVNDGGGSGFPGTGTDGPLISNILFEGFNATANYTSTPFMTWAGIPGRNITLKNIRASFGTTANPGGSGASNNQTGQAFFMQGGTQVIKNLSFEDVTIIDYKDASVSAIIVSAANLVNVSGLVFNRADGSQTGTLVSVGSNVLRLALNNLRVEDLAYITDAGSTVNLAASNWNNTNFGAILSGSPASTWGDVFGTAGSGGGNLDGDGGGGGPTLVAQWNLSDLTDASGNGYALTDNSGPTSFVTGLVGNCAQFTGANWLSQGSLAISPMGAGNSMSIWGNIAATPSSNAALFTSSGPMGVQVFVLSSGNLYFAVGSTGFDTGVVFPLGQWNHVVVTQGAGVANCYLNGTLVATQSLTLGTWGGGDTELGAAAGGASAQLTGLIDQVRVFSGILPATGSLSVASLYNGGAGN